jgi:hypothetical protein
VHVFKLNLYIIFSFSRWIQIARRIISRSRREASSSSGGGGGGSGRLPPSLPERAFNGSENDLRLDYNSVLPAAGQYGSPAGQYESASQYGSPPPGQYEPAGQYGALPPTASGRSALYGGRDGIRFSPDGRMSPEIQVYKTRVIYHSKQDRPDHHSSV